MSHAQPLWRRAVAEALGTGLLVTVVIGSGIAAASLSPGDIGLQLLENAFATALGLAVLILMLGPVSGAHFNPAVSVIDWWLGQRTSSGLSLRDLAAYIPAQIGGGIAGAILANLMYGEAAVSWSTTDRSAGHLYIGETVATAGLILLIFALAWSGRAQLAPLAVGAYIGSAYWFTSSTSFANPAVTIGRAFSDTFAGIAPGSVPAFIAFQAFGAILGAALVIVLYPNAGQAADDVVTPTHTGASS
ncbi:glycerol uptake facilitator-like aquaporin [Kribbella sp. VKM Ac-2527]|uniref:Glycerol uptake facilitator-like aquaporin n=1 Tax=Kribbella caucasensis TaxID=2512215 RepID=A0A4R6K4P1_9ACTN|nr:MIP/aquaporin family protein [Kribbella sp. VKM Ac-2527]TDO44274.1 glycerol uptake facilitator-like aquaporin [Kribbella sp. VKM Ac-2527]